MKLSKLSFTTERVSLNQGDQCGNYLAFYFFIDGCGVWGCSSLVAKCKAVSDNIIEWTVDEYRYERDPQKYYFDKSECDKVIAELICAAKKEQENFK